MRQRLTVNGDEVELDVEPGATLLHVLREQLGLRGSKEACGRGECGACTVLHGQEPVAACAMLAGLVTEPVQTIEGLAPECVDFRGRLTDAGGFQCGYCTPGFVVRAMALEREDVRDERSLRAALAGNVCRCTGYDGLVEAMLEADVR